MREKRWLLCFLVAVCCTFSTWALPSQDKTVTLNLHNVSIETVLDAVKKQTGVNMLYNSQMFKGVPPVSINAKNEKWEVALKLILNPQGFDYVVKDGIELCRTLKQDIRTSHIPVILLTAKDTLEDKEEGYEAGADSYLTKPFSASLLHSRIRNLLELRSKLANKIGSVNWSDKKEQVIESLNQIDNEFIEKVTALIEEDISSDKIDTNYIADHLCMSISTLYRKMKALTNLSTNEFIRKVKMKNAERMLLEQKYTISEISYKVGINTVSYFRQCFLKEYGLSPTQYLKKVKGVTIKDEEE